MRTSVVIPTYNRATMLGRAIESVFAAIEPGDEIIVVDDGSTDATPSVLAEFGDRIRSIRSANGGVGRARNLGIAAAVNPLVAFLDSDDEWTPDRLALGRRLLESRADILFCFSDFGGRSEGQPDRHNGVRGWMGREERWAEDLGPGVPYSTLATCPSGREDFLVYIGDLYPSLLEACGVAVQTLLVRREAAGAALRFAEDLRIFEDWECAARLARAGKAAFLACETAWQWGHDGQRVSDAHHHALATAQCRITMAERLWGSDAAFLAHSAGRVRALLDRQHVIVAKALISEGRTAEARASLRRTESAPLITRVLALLPGPVVRAILAARQRFRRG